MTARPGVSMPKTFLRLVLVAMLARPVAAEAQPRTAPELQRARTALVTYDLEGDATLAVLRELGTFAQSGAPEDQRREARFLRAMASVDLLIVATIVSDEDLPRRVASALGASETGLVPYLEAELASVRSGPYSDAAREATACLRIVRGEPVDFTSFRGNRRDALFVRAAAKALRAAPDPLPVLASLGRDPCAGGSVCSGPEALFPSDVRVALSVATDLRQTVRRLERAVASGDPVSAFVTDDVLTVKQAWGAVVGHPAISLPSSLPLAAMATGPSAPDVDVLIVVGPRGVRYAFIPVVTSDDARGPHVDSLGTPVLPSLAETSFPASLSPENTAIPELVTSLRAVVAGGRKVAVSAEAAIPSQLIVRVVRSVAEAGGSVVGLAGRTPDGTLRTVAITAPTGSDVAAQVDVRLGGYEVDVGRSHSRISRIRTPEGFRFDVAGLERTLRDRTFPAVSVRFAGGVTYEPLAEALSRLRSEAPIELFLPR